MQKAKLEQAENYINLSKQAEQENDLINALEYQLKAVDILKKLLPDDDLQLADAYDRLSKLLYINGYLPKTLMFSKKALEIRKKKLPENSKMYTPVSEIFNQI